MQVIYCLVVVFIFFVAESFLFLVEMEFDLFFFLSSTLFVTFTYVTLKFLLFEKFEINFMMEYLPVHSKPHERPVCCLTMSLTVSILLSKSVSLLKIKFGAISANTVTASYCDCCNSRTCTNCYCIWNCHLPVVCSSPVCHC